jgi:hypothetical protein
MTAHNTSPSIRTCISRRRRANAPAGKKVNDGKHHDRIEILEKERREILEKKKK